MGVCYYVRHIDRDNPSFSIFIQRLQEALTNFIGWKDKDGTARFVFAIPYVLPKAGEFVCHGIMVINGIIESVNYDYLLPSS